MAFAIFSTHMLLSSTQDNMVVFAAAWYTSSAGVINGMRDEPLLPVGGKMGQ